jgi:hypothetical protein
MLPCGETLTKPRPAPAALLRGVRRPYFPHSPPSLFRFGRQYQQESSPGCVTNTFGEVMVLDHPANLQIFDREVIKLSDQRQAHLVQEVEPLPFDLQVLTRQKADSFTTVVAPAMLPADASLCRFQSSRRTAQVLWVGDGRARRKGSELLNSKIYADTRARLCEVATLVAFDAERDIPAVNFSLDSEGLDSAFYRTGEAHATTADFREVKLVAFKFSARLRIGERIIAILVSKTWIACFLTRFDSMEEGVESLLDALQSVLQDLAVGGGNVRTLTPYVWQLIGLMIIADRDARLPISVTPLSQRSIV